MLWCNTFNKVFVPDSTKYGDVKMETWKRAGVVFDALHGIIYLAHASIFLITIVFQSVCL